MLVYDGGFVTVLCLCLCMVVGFYFVFFFYIQGFFKIFLYIILCIELKIRKCDIW